MNLQLRLTTTLKARVPRVVRLRRKNTEIQIKMVDTVVLPLRAKRV
jgi:hypothetical protein